jgi:hypothetical protein
MQHALSGYFGGETNFLTKNDVWMWEGQQNKNAVSNRVAGARADGLPVSAIWSIASWVNSTGTGYAPATVIRVVVF